MYTTYMGFELKALLSATLLAMGIVLPLEAFSAGLFLALGCAYGVMAFSEPESRSSVLLTLYLAVFVATLFAIFHPHIPIVKNLPVQGVMAVAGALSRPITAAVGPFGRGLSKWAEKLPDTITSFWKKGKD